MEEFISRIQQIKRKEEKGETVVKGSIGKGIEISDKYTDIEQIKSEIESLGDWKDPSKRDSYLKVISKIISIYHGYELDNGERKCYPEEVIKAIADICSKKFPSTDEAFKDEKGPEMPDSEFLNYVTLSTTPLGISLLGERTRIDRIAREKFGIDVYHTQMTEEEARKLIESSEQYLEDIAAQASVSELGIRKGELTEFQRIMALLKRRRTIKKEISIEEQKKSENLHELDD